MWQSNRKRPLSPSHTLPTRHRLGAAGENCFSLEDPDHALRWPAQPLQSHAPGRTGAEWPPSQPPAQPELYFFPIFYLFIFRVGGSEGEREGEKHQCVVASHMPPTGDLARSPGMCPDWELYWQPFGSQVSIQSTEPHQPGPNDGFKMSTTRALS